MTDDDTMHLELPDAFRDELRRRDKAIPVISAKVDRAIDELTRAHFATRPASGRRAPLWLASAATILLAVFWSQTTDGPVRSDSLLFTDVDQSGQIDIADVFALARINDGSVTAAQLENFAASIVSLAMPGEAS